MPGDGRASSPAPPASLPKTPKHPSRGAAIDEIIRSLEAEWRIGLKIRDQYWSPKRSSLNDEADRIYGLVKRLFYSAKTNLDQAIAIFRKLAPLYDTPKERLKLLHHALLSHDPVSRAGTAKVAPPSGLTSSLIVASKVTPPSGSPRDTRNDNTESWATAVEPGSPTDIDTDDEFVTPSPPTSSPSPSSRSNHNRAKASACARKRPSDCSTQSQQSPKFKKTLKGKEAVKPTMPVQLTAPILFKKPSLNMARSFQAVASISSANTSFNTTSNSSQETNATTVNTSFTSYDGVSDIEQHPQTARTRDELVGSLKNPEFLHIVGNSNDNVLGLAKPGEIGRLFSQELSRESSSTFGSIDENGLSDASCKAEEEADSRRSWSSPRGTRSAANVTSTGPNNVTHWCPPAHSTVGVPVDTPRLRTRSSSKGVPLVAPTKLRAETLTNTTAKEAYYIRELPQHNLFVDPLPDELSAVPFFILFICCRLSISHGVPMKALMDPMDVKRNFGDAKSFWDTVRYDVQETSRESKGVWAAAKKSFEGFSFKGNVTFDERCAQSNTVFKLDLACIEPEKSCLFERMFGSDRFLYLTFPSFTKNTPKRFDRKQMHQIEEQWKLWTLQPHSFLGRIWRLFYLEPIKKKNMRTDQAADKRVVLFATRGLGINKPMLVGEMLNEFMDLSRNQSLNYCKAYARIELGLSRTIATFVFKPSQIRRIRDKLSDDTPEPSEFNDAKLDWSEQCEERQVMNDGCARISVGAALLIWRLYRESTGSNDALPSAFQGRIRGAKGMWMISSAPHTREKEHLDVWIEVTDSQLKFEPTLDDEDDGLYNPHRLTFNYVKHSFVNGSTDLHMDFIPILTDRGVSREAITKFIVSVLDEERSRLLGMLYDPVGLHNWVTKQGSLTSALGNLSWQAGLPLAMIEKVKLLLRSGFAPDQSPYLAHILKKFVEQHQTWMEQKLRVPLGKATFLLGLADPENVLDPGVVHVQFSSPFIDEVTRTTHRNLDGVELLVARQPACRPSDIQKVRAISHSQLSHLVDVIVFPTKGRFPLAGKLQGGDYDGDTFWVCWEPQLVQPFQNAPAPLKSPDPMQYGITKDVRRLNEVMNPRDLTTVDGWLKEVLNFRTQPSLLGKATNFQEKLCYRENCISSSTINAFFDMHDLLVDAPKQAYLLTEHDFYNMVHNKAGYGKLPVPAYKEAMDASSKIRDMNAEESDSSKRRKYNPKHILDYLYFGVLRKHNSETRKLLKDALFKEEDDDPQLRLPVMQLRGKCGKNLRDELDNLVRGFDKIAHDWNRNLGGSSTLSLPSYMKILDSCYKSFQALVPSNANARDPEIAPLLFPYFGETHPTIWETIRASALYTTYPKKHTFVWSMAGKELCRLKVSGDPHTYNVVPGVFADLKTKPNKAPKLGEEDSDDDFQSVMDSVTG